MEEALRAFPEHPEVKLLDARMQTLREAVGPHPAPASAASTPTRSPPRSPSTSITCSASPCSWRASAPRRSTSSGAARVTPGGCDLGLGLALATPLDDPAAASRVWAPDEPPSAP